DAFDEIGDLEATATMRNEPDLDAVLASPHHPWQRHRGIFEIEHEHVVATLQPDALRSDLEALRRALGQRDVLRRRAEHPREHLARLVANFCLSHVDVETARARTFGEDRVIAVELVARRSRKESRCPPVEVGEPAVERWKLRPEVSLPGSVHADT